MTDSIMESFIVFTNPDEKEERVSVLIKLATTHTHTHTAVTCSGDVRYNNNHQHIIRFFFYSAVVWRVVVCLELQLTSVTT